MDIGAHTGETLRVVSDARWGFDRIICFEPAPDCWSTIRGLADDRVELYEFGLWKEDGTILLHNPGAVGASMSADKDSSTQAVPCEFRDGARWFAENLSAEDQIFAKINVEGAEADIIGRLAATGQLSKIAHLLIHFDVRKVPSLRGREAELRRQLVASDVEFLSADEIQFGGVYRGTRNWLAWCHARPRTRDLRYKKLSRIIFRLRHLAYPLKQRIISRGGGARTA